MEYFDPFIYNFKLFLIVMARIEGLFLIAPFYSSAAIPARFKGLFAFLVTLASFPMISTLNIVIPEAFPALLIILVLEL